MPYSKRWLPIGIAVAAALLAAPAQAGAAWRTSFEVAGSPASIEALDAGGPGELWAVGGRPAGAAYDVPTAWHRVAKGWAPMSIPVDLSGRWGYLTDISSVGAGDAWASGLTVAQRNGSALPLLAHWNGATWTVVDHPWVAPSETGAFTAVSSRSPADVWAAGSHAAGTQSLPMFWHFDGGVWSQVAVPVRNRQCSAGGDISITGIAAAADGVYLSFNCQTGTFQLAGTVQRFSAGRWHAVLKLDSRQIVLGLGLVGQTIWAVGSAWNGTAVQGAAWSGNAAGLTRQPLSLPTGTVFRAVAGNASQVFLAGERNDLGPLPFLMQGTIADGFIATPVPYDRGLSAVTLSENRRAWLAGPTFGGWLGGTPPHAAVLTSPPPR